MMAAPRTHDDYQIGWICALPLEMTAARLMLDNTHPKLSQPPQDNNTYTLGDVHGHNVVVACLPSGVYGTTAAAVVASQMLSTYHNIRFGLLVGIGGGVPSASIDIRLGDVVVSNPSGTSPGVVQYDFGKTVESGRLQRTGALSLPHPALLTALAHIRGDHLLDSPKFCTDVLEILRSRKQQEPGEPSMFHYPGQDEDVLFRPSNHHLDSEAESCSRDKDLTVERHQRLSNSPKVHYGTIASGNQVMKDGYTRDNLARELGILCFEMEAAGLMNNFPCLVIRGICDYADSHKNKEWQGYAALTAAAYAKELLSVVPFTYSDRPQSKSKERGSNDEQVKYHFNNHGSGPQFNSFGGDQNNNTAGGNLISRATFSGPVNFGKPT